MMGSAMKDLDVLNLNSMRPSSTRVMAMILTTVVIGQPTVHVNVANCMRDCINNYFVLFTTYAFLAIEASGILHSVYLVQIFFSKITGTPIDWNLPPRTGVQNAVFWVRVLMSLGLLSFAFAVTLSALFNGQTTMWEGIPETVSVIVFFILMCFAGMMEGIQNANRFVCGRQHLRKNSRITRSHIPTVN
jgi:hypothetical protein